MHGLADKKAFYKAQLLLAFHVISVEMKKWVTSHQTVATRGCSLSNKEATKSMKFQLTLIFLTLLSLYVPCGSLKIRG